MKTNPPASNKSPKSRKKPRIMRHLTSLDPENVSHLGAGVGNSAPSGRYQLFRPPFQVPGAGRALTVQRVHSIRAALAAGAIPPPQFFERRRRFRIDHLSTCREWRPRGYPQHELLDHAFG